MTKREIRELQGFYVQAALRAKRVGFDVVNFCVNEDCTVIQQFLMPRYNHRTDEYSAATMDNRSRFMREVVEQVREAVHDSCAVTVRLSIDTLDAEKRGIDAAETAPAMVELTDHLVDLWDMEVCGPIMQEWGDAAGPSRFFREGYQVPYVAKCRPYTKKPIVAVSRWVHPDAMLAAVESGVIDIIGMARPGIADPFIPAKIDEGRTDDIRECIGCNICVLAVRAAHLDHLHPERHHRRGIPPGLAPRALQPWRRTARATSSSWARGRPGWSARGSWRNAACAGSTSSTARRRWAATSTG